MDFYLKSFSTLVSAAAVATELPPVRFSALEKHPFAEQKKQVMQPFLGELGLEVRAFLGQIEPWLRSGWVIPARRTALYPSQCSFEDPVFFNRVDEIKTAYGLREMVGRLDNFVPKRTFRHSASKDDGRFDYHASADFEQDLLPTLVAQRELRRAFLDRYGHEFLIPTQWHTELTSLCQGDDRLFYASRQATRPSYLPPNFADPPLSLYPHIGIQLRNLAQNPGRNSDPDVMQRLAALASGYMDLPVLVYGRTTDLGLSDRPRTTDLIPRDLNQLSAELGFLSNCMLMISPDSGWADLMGWLRVPTLLERLEYPWGFEGLRPFQPRMVLAEGDDDEVLASIKSICECGGDKTILPDCNAGRDHQSTFLHPLGDSCRKYWAEFAK
jgi:hypothetical protein